MKSHIRQSADGDDPRFNPPEQPAVGVKRSHKDANHPARNGLFRWRYKIEFSSPALSNHQTRNDASGVSSAPIHALLFEARLNFAVKRAGGDCDRLTRSQRRRRVGVQPTSSNVAGQQCPFRLGSMSVFIPLSQSPT
jgi:hypothetical protein